MVAAREAEVKVAVMEAAAMVAAAMVPKTPTIAPWGAETLTMD